MTLKGSLLVRFIRGCVEYSHYFCPMDYVFEKKWGALLKKLEVKFDMPWDLQAVLFLIGVQELGQGFKGFS